MTISFKRHPDADRRIKSAKIAIQAILAVRDQLCTQHLRELLSICIWKISEADGKYKTRYQSVAALARSTELHHEELRHEHPFERKKLIDELIEFPEDIDRIAKKSFGCVVTLKDHMKLNKVDKSLSGWDRYREAGIPVMDTLTGIHLDLSQKAPITD